MDLLRDVVVLLAGWRGVGRGAGEVVGISGETVCRPGGEMSVAALRPKAVGISGERVAGPDMGSADAVLGEPMLLVATVSSNIIVVTFSASLEAA
jgi:hypothetical protein